LFHGLYSWTAGTFRAAEQRSDLGKCTSEHFNAFFVNGEHSDLVDHGVSPNWLERLKVRTYEMSDGSTAIAIFP
jgi:hypothetical protein